MLLMHVLSELTVKNIDNPDRSDASPQGHQSITRDAARTCDTVSASANAEAWLIEGRLER
jgi:hypothetical protein